MSAATFPALPLRDGSLPFAALCDLYMAQYAGRDRAVSQRLGWWRDQLGHLRIDEIDDDQVHEGLQRLAARPARCYAGRDADGKPIFRGKGRGKPLAAATLNRYLSAVASVFTWAERRRIVPKGYSHPVRRVEYQRENNGKTRFLSDDERTRLLAACQASKWPRLYLLVLLALTTGGRKGELLGLHWRDVDLARRLVHIGRSKNGEPKALPLTPAVVEQLQRFQGPPGALVFPSRLRAAQPMHFEAHWRQALAEAGIKSYRFHDNRHSCASLLAQNGASLLEIADLLGHRQISMTHRYSHLAATHRSALVDRVMGELR